MKWRNIYMEQKIADSLIKDVSEYCNNKDVKTLVVSYDLRNKKHNWKVTFIQGERNNRFVLAEYDTWEFYCQRGDADLVTKLIKEGLKELTNGDS